MISVCPLCNVKYNPLQLRILDEKIDAHLVYITCRNCCAGVVALIMNRGMGVTSVGLITDLSADDVIKFKESKDLRSEDVLELHQLLESNEEDYLKLFIE